MNIFKQYIKNFDFSLLAAVVILNFIGVLLVASAAFSTRSNSFVVIQAAASVLGIIGSIVISFIDYKLLAKYSKYIFALNIFLLILVLIIGVGGEEVGGKRWIRFGAIGIQPSEIVKIGFIISFSYHVDRYKDKINNIWVILGLTAHIAVITVLIMRQPDFGTTMVFVSMFVAVIFIMRVSYKYIISAFLASPAIGFLLWQFVFKEFQKSRIINFLNPANDLQITGYQVAQSKTAIGAGQLFGQGLFKGICTQNGFLPAARTDFIFAVAGEELGFIGAAIIVLLIVFIVARCFIIAYKAKDTLGMTICAGVGTMLLVQSFENIGMTVGLMPVTGITLPFLSYGGSSIVTNYMAIGLVFAVKVRSRKLTFSNMI